MESCSGTEPFGVLLFKKDFESSNVLNGCVSCVEGCGRNSPMGENCVAGRGENFPSLS